MAVDLAAAIALSSAMVRTLLDSLSINDNQGQKATPPSPQRGEATILSIASDLQIILGEVMVTATAIFPQKLAAPKRVHFPIISGPNLSDMMSIKSAGG